mmetsp:Transcript_10888/g.36178  ORF Transcript_10888/g.36178 Transcript_10888/m.36178 type:complete len:215 (+) Transcript_10888:670-1314(+)
MRVSVRRSQKQVIEERMRNVPGSTGCRERSSSSPKTASAWSCVSRSASSQVTPCSLYTRRHVSRNVLPQSICTCFVWPSAPRKRSSAPTLLRQFLSARPLRSAGPHAVHDFSGDCGAPIAQPMSGSPELQPVPVKRRPLSAVRRRRRRDASRCTRRSDAANALTQAAARINLRAASCEAPPFRHTQNRIHQSRCLTAAAPGAVNRRGEPSSVSR